MSEAEQYASEIRNALSNVVGGGDLSTDDLLEMQQSAFVALDELESLCVWYGEKLDNIGAEIGRRW